MPNYPVLSSLLLIDEDQGIGCGKARVNNRYRMKHVIEAGHKSRIDERTIGKSGAVTFIIHEKRLVNGGIVYDQ